MNQYFLALILAIIQVCDAGGYDRVFIQYFTDFRTSEPRNFWQVYDHEAEDYIVLNEPLYCSDSDPRFYGPFNSDSDAFYRIENLSPNRQIRGEFQILILGAEKNSQFFADNLELNFDEDPIVNIVEIKQVNGSMPCSGYGNENNLWNIKFFHPFLKSDINTEIELSIKVNLDGLGKNWAFRNLIVQGSFCKWDCNGCVNDVNQCSSCHKISVIKRGEECFCKDNYLPTTIEPLRCSPNNTNVILPDHCYLEYILYVKQSFYTPSCKIVDKRPFKYLYCSVNQTRGFPISEECFSHRTVSFCTIKENKTQPKICFETNLTVSEDNLATFTNGYDVSEAWIPISELDHISRNRMNLENNGQYWYLKFTLDFKLLKNTFSSNPQEPFYGYVWQYQIQKEHGFYEMKDMITDYDPIQIQMHYCQDRGCVKVLTNFWRYGGQVYYFKVHSDQVYFDHTIDIAEITQSYFVQKKYYYEDLKDELRLVTQISDAEQIYSFKLKPQKNFLLGGSQFTEDINGNTVNINAEWTPINQIVNE